MKSILITGGSGSFGQAFTQYILENVMANGRIVIYSRGEHLQEEMQRKFAAGDPNGRLRFFIGDVRDKDRLEFAMRGVDTVVHAAALKIVPTAEYNPTECVATNIYGAENVVKAAIRTGVKRVVGLSTDKAVNPINLYGATKLAAEKIFIAANYLGAGATSFGVVRYGNVAGSRGSVIPLFLRLKKEGRKLLPITDKNMTRFWVTMQQAIDMVMLAARQSSHAIYIPKVPSMSIMSLAEVIHPDGGVEEIGIRPGEKLHECLLTEDEARDAFVWPDHYEIFPMGGLVSDSLSLCRPIKPGFRYTSDTNSEWLSLDQMREIIRCIERQP